MGSGQPSINIERGFTWKLARVFLRAVTWLWARPMVSGPGVVPESGPVILAPTHRSYVDFLMLLFTTDRKPFFMTRAEFLRIPVIGVIMVLLGCIGVEKSMAADRSVMRLSEEVLGKGQVLVVFPEGGLRRGSHVDTLTDGVMFLAARTGAAVVPIGLGLCPLGPGSRGFTAYAW